MQRNVSDSVGYEIILLIDHVSLELNRRRTNVHVPS